MTYVIAAPCVGVLDKACVGVCPVDCIHESPLGEMLFIDPEICIDCGACEPMCPVGAIFLESAIPEAFREYVAKNAAYARERSGG